MRWVCMTSDAIEGCLLKSNSKKLRVKFRDIAENIVLRVDVPSESGYERFVGGRHLDSETLKIKKWGSTSDVHAQKLIFKKGHILFGKRRSYLRKVAYADFDGVCSAHMLVLKNKPEYVLDNFFIFFMQSNQFWKTADMISEGSMSPTIKWKILAKQEFTIPSKEEQNRIASFLWAIESSIGQVEEVIIKTQRLKKGLMKELFTKGIGHTEFKETQLGKTPITWEIRSIEDISRISGGSTPSTKNRDYWKGPIPFVTPTDITSLTNSNYINKTKRSITEKALRTIPNNLLDPGTILLTSRATIGKSAINTAPLVTNQGFINIKTKPKINGLWLLYYLRYHKRRIIRLASGSTFKEISRRSFKRMNILVPPLEEQEKISSILSRTDDNCGTF